MISLNIWAQLLLSVFYVKKEKNMTYTSKINDMVEIILNNAFMIFVIFKNNTVNI